MSRSIFAVVFYPNAGSLHENSYFSNVESARKCLKKLADERRYNLGVNCFKEDEDSFSFILGWEEARVTCKIIELSLQE